MWYVYCTKCPADHLNFHYFAKVWTKLQGVERARTWSGDEGLAVARIVSPPNVDVIRLWNDHWEFFVREG
jgi:hypothetical protein